MYTDSGIDRAQPEPGQADIPPRTDGATPGSARPGLGRSAPSADRGALRSRRGHIRWHFAPHLPGQLLRPVSLPPSPASLSPQCVKPLLVGLQWREALLRLPGRFPSPRVSRAHGTLVIPGGNWQNKSSLKFHENTVSCLFT